MFVLLDLFVLLGLLGVLLVEFRLFVFFFFVLFLLVLVFLELFGLILFVFVVLFWWFFFFLLGLDFLEFFVLHNPSEFNYVETCGHTAPYTANLRGQSRLWVWTADGGERPTGRRSLSTPIGRKGLA